MRILTKEQYLKEAEPMLRKIFITDELLDDRMLATNVAGRVLLYPSYGYVGYPLIEAVIAAAEKLGKEGCYVSDPNQFYGDKAIILYIPFSELLSVYIEPGPQNIEEQFKSMLSPDHFMFSEQGKWAIRTSSASYGFLGSSLEFIKYVRKFYPEIDREIYDFLDYWRAEKKYIDRLLSEGRKVYVTIESWLPQLLTHIYGEEKAIKLLQETGLP